MLNRRDLLLRSGSGFGALALAAMTPPARAATSPLASRKPPLPARAKAVIYLFQHGAPSHVDTFDPKPELDKRTGQNLPPALAKTIKTSFIQDPTRAMILGSPWKFRPGGQSGLPVSDLFPHVREHADRLLVVRGCQGDVFDHSPAMYLRLSGSQFPGRPSLGAWVTYGLGSENQYLPAFVVMTDGSMKSGPPVYGAGFLPSVYQGTLLRGAGDPILYLHNPPGVSPEVQRRTLKMVDRLDRIYQQPRAEDTTLEARILSYELAFRMQAAAPDAVDLSKETAATRALYGIGAEPTDGMGRKCLLARRLVERGVRFVQIFSGTNVGDDWDDAHGDLLGSHEKMAAKTDRPIAGLLSDLAARGLLDSTLVVWGASSGARRSRRARTGATTTRTGSRSGWPGPASLAGARSAPPTTWASRPWRCRSTRTTSTPPSCACSASSTRA